MLIKIHRSGCLSVYLFVTKLLLPSDLSAAGGKQGVGRYPMRTVPSPQSTKTQPAEGQPGPSLQKDLEKNIENMETSPKLMLMMKRDTVANVQSPVWELANQVVEKHVCCRENLGFAHFQANLKSLFWFNAKIFCHVYLWTKIHLKVTRHHVFSWHSMGPFPSKFVFWIYTTFNSCNMFPFQCCPFQLFKLPTLHFNCQHFLHYHLYCWLAVLI